MDVEALPVQIKRLLHHMVNMALARGLQPLYIQCPYWEDEGMLIDSAVSEKSVLNVGVRWAKFPAAQVNGVPIQFKQDVCKVYCRDRQVIRAWLNPNNTIQIEQEFE